MVLGLMQIALVKAYTKIDADQTADNATDISGHKGDMSTEPPADPAEKANAD